MVTVAMDQDEIDALLKRGIVGRLAMVTDQGPYVVPLGYVYENGRIGFHSSPKGRKVECFSNDRRVCFEVDEANPEITQYKSVLVFGTIEEAKDRGTKLQVLKSLVEKYPTERRRRIDFKGCVDEAAVFLISPEKITGKKRTGE
jgi:nitroimidazol reductase NimA-like FMN-containing flavoprotein (pyridoxamine 5'-phosphate oxidase superfamily)